jgi:hypothetical protein
MSVNVRGFFLFWGVFVEKQKGLSHEALFHFGDNPYIKANKLDKIALFTACAGKLFLVRLESCEQCRFTL